jgi:hypothetical protein
MVVISWFSSGAQKARQVDDYWIYRIKKICASPPPALPITLMASNSSAGLLIAQCPVTCLIALLKPWDKRCLTLVQASDTLTHLPLSQSNASLLSSLLYVIWPGSPHGTLTWFSVGSFDVSSSYYLILDRY